MMITTSNQLRSRALIDSGKICIINYRFLCVLFVITQVARPAVADQASPDTCQTDASICEKDAACCAAYLRGRDLHNQGSQSSNFSPEERAEKLRSALKHFLIASASRSTAFLKLRICAVQIELKMHKEAAISWAAAAAIIEKSPTQNQRLVERLAEMKKRLASAESQAQVHKAEEPVAEPAVAPKQSYSNPAPAEQSLQEQALRQKLQQQRSFWADVNQRTPELQMKIALLKAQLLSERRKAAADYADLQKAWGHLAEDTAHRKQLAELCRLLGSLCPEAPRTGASAGADPASRQATTSQPQPVNAPSKPPAGPQGQAAGSEKSAALVVPEPNGGPPAGLQPQSLRPTSEPSARPVGTGPTVNLSAQNPVLVPPAVDTPGAAAAPHPAPGRAADPAARPKRFCPSFSCGILLGSIGTLVVMGVVVGGVLGWKFEQTRSASQ